VAVGTRSLADRLIQFYRPRPLTTFAPPPTPIAPDLWSLERRLQMPAGPRLPTLTTIIRLPSNGLLVVSPPAEECGGLEALEALGPIEEVLVPNSFHYVNVPEFARRHARATLRMAPALPDRVAGLPAGEPITAAPIAAWRGAIEHAVLGPVRGISEVALFHVASATLVLTDVAFNLVGIERRFDRLVWRLAGIPAAFGPSRTARAFLLPDRAIAGDFLRRVLAWPFRRVLVAHGEPLEHDAHAVFQRAFAAYLDRVD
jgi:hypothetical protein